jgi:hypothetical protein
MTRLTMLFLAVALVLPGAAFSMPAREAGTVAEIGSTLDKHGVDQAAAQRKAEAIGRYYATFRAAKPLPAPVEQPAPAASDGTGNGLSWSIAIGAGIALMLVAGGLGLYAGRMVRPRHLGA